MRPGADIVVVNYRTPEDLQGFLDSLDVHIPHDLWIVNVAPQIEDRDVAWRWLDHHGPGVHLIECADNVGYGTAANRAAMSGDREVIAIFNADVRVWPASIESCAYALMANDDWGVLGPLQLDERRRVTHAGIFGTNTEPQFRGWRSQSSDDYHDVREAVTVSGSAYFVWRTLWEELARCDGCIGAFLPTPLYYEETWCSYHARAHGYKVMYYGPVTLTHKWQQSVLKSGESEAMRKMKIAREMFREACDAHGIEHD